MSVQAAAPATATGPLIPDQYAFCEISSDFATWEAQPYLVPLRAGSTTGRTIGRASIRYDYGLIKREDLDSFSTWSPRELVDRYLRIRVTESGRTWTAWTGVISDEVLSILGTEDAPAGAQTFPAYELAHLLDRTAIFGAQALRGTTEVEIGRMPAFNRPERRGLGLTGNRSDTLDSAGVYRFDAGGEVWSHLDILNYLLAYHAPPQFTLTLAGNYAALDNIRTALSLEGRTLYACLNALIDRRRGFVWSLEPDDSGTVSLHVDTVFGAPVSMGAGEDLPANARQRSLTFDNAIDLGEVTLSKLSGRKFDRIRVLGGPVVACCTFSFTAGNLEKAWTDTEETAYANVAGADNTEKDRERKSDKYGRVYQALRVPDDWNGIGDDGEGFGGWIAVVDANDDGSLAVTSLAALWPEDKAFLRWIPVYEPEDETDTTRERELMRPVVLLKDGTTWHQIDAVESDDLSAAYVRCLDGELGVELRPRINHILGKHHFTADSDIETEWDYETMCVTAAFATDTRLQVIVGSGDRELVVRVPEAQSWYVCPRTVIGVEDGDLRRFDPTLDADDDYQTRDDAPYLRALANLLHAWHNTERAELDLTVRRLGRYVDIGGYITQAASGNKTDEVGTVVTSLDWDFTQHETTIRTGYAELDALGLPYEPGESDPSTVASELKTVKAALQEEKSHAAHLDVRAPRLPFERGSEVAAAIRSFTVSPTGYTASASSPYATNWNDLDEPITLDLRNTNRYPEPDLVYTGIFSSYTFRIQNNTGSSTSAIMNCYLEFADAAFTQGFRVYLGNSVCSFLSSAGVLVKSTSDFWFPASSLSLSSTAIGEGLTVVSDRAAFVASQARFLVEHYSGSWSPGFIDGSATIHFLQGPIQYIYGI